MSAAGFRVAMLGPIDIALLRRLWAPESSLTALKGHQGAVSLTTLVDALVRSGTAVTAVTTCVFADSTVHEVLSENLDLIVVPQRLRGFGRDFQYYERRDLQASLDGLAVDLVHAHWTYEYALAALRARQRPVLISVHDWAPAIFRNNPHPFNAARIASQLSVLRRARFVTANSPYIAARLNRIGCHPTMLPNAISGQRFVKASSSTRSSPAPLIVAINNGFSGGKNVGTLLVAFALVRRRFPNARLALVGGEHEPGGIAERWAGSRGLRENVEFIGRVDDSAVGEWLQAATVFVHPSKEESFGGVLVEAMAARVPVIAGARSGAVPWVVADAGILCDVSQPEALAEAISSTLLSQDLRQHLADRGYQNAWDRFHADTVVKTALGIYGQILNGDVTR